MDPDPGKSWIRSIPAGHDRSVGVPFPSPRYRSALPLRQGRSVQISKGGIFFSIQKMGVQGAVAPWWGSGAEAPRKI